MVMGLVDEKDGWDGPKYVVYGIKYIVGSQLADDITGWDGRKVFNSDVAFASERRRGRERGAETGKGDHLKACLQKSFWV